MTSALILHAHPDDEVLFAGALREARPDWAWTTVSLTGGARASQYPGLSLGFADEWRILSLSEYREWRQAVADLDLQPDFVFTHNRMGEYGHPHHMSVHRIAHELFPSVWDFLVEAETSVGPQLVAERVTEVPATAAKGQRFIATYGEAVLNELCHDRPEMMSDLFRYERFTGPEYLPR